jgi:hypothetical protein
MVSVTIGPSLSVIWEKGMWVDFSEEARKVKTFVSHVNSYQRVTSAEEDSSNEVGWMT